MNIATLNSNSNGQLNYLWRLVSQIIHAQQARLAIPMSEHLALQEQNFREIIIQLL